MEATWVLCKVLPISHDTVTFKALIKCIICFSDEDNEIVVRIAVQVGGFKPQLVSHVLV